MQWGMNMKLKYYLRGIGVGILFATIVLTVANQSLPKSTLTDEEIISRAKKLGMVEKTEDITGLLSTPTPTPGHTEGSSDKDSSDKNSTKENKTDETTANDTVTEGEATVEEVTPTVTVELTLTPVPTKEVSENEVFSVQKVRIKIEKGTTSEGVAKLLMEKGIIEDAEGFSQYLKQNDYTRDIRIGEYELEVHSSYKNIADKIIFK